MFKRAVFSSKNAWFLMGFCKIEKEYPSAENVIAEAAITLSIIGNALCTLK